MDTGGQVEDVLVQVNVPDKPDPEAGLDNVLGRDAVQLGSQRLGGWCR